MEHQEFRTSRREALRLLKQAGIVITRRERDAMEITDLGLGDSRHIGLQIIVYENSSRYCAKEIVMLPRQICPEHRHPPLDAENPGKRETFRCRWGAAYLYVPGVPARNPRARVHARYRPFFTVWHEIVLTPGEQYTLPPDTLHWFQAGPRGAVLSEFSSYSVDETDVFTHPHIKRVTTAP